MSIDGLTQTVESHGDNFLCNKATNNASNCQDKEEVLEKRKTGEKRKKQKLIKKKDFEANLVLGMDVQIEEALEMLCSIHTKSG